MLEEYHIRQPNAYACMGLTFYKEHKIWIAKELCKDEKIRTLKHELTHCYIGQNAYLSLRDRIDKANEYIRTGKTFDTIDIGKVVNKIQNDLLNILEGSDKK